MDEYYCPNCNATLNDQWGFDPSNGTWTCTECGKLLMDDDVYDGDSYEGVAWFCDECNALLNRQYGFSDSYGTWTCTECGHINGTTEDDIRDDSNNRIECPRCGENLKSQYSFSEYYNDYTCSSCGCKLHRDYSFDDFEIVEEIACPSCGTNLVEQYDFESDCTDWVCEMCDEKLHRDTKYDDFEIIEEQNNESNSYTNSSNSYTSHQSYTRASYTDIPNTSRSKTPDKKTNGELLKKKIKAFIFKKKKIAVGYSSSYLLHKDVNAINTLFYNQAFSNIKLIPIKDIDSTSTNFVGEVEQIVIDRQSWFECDDMFPYDSEVIITYHEKKEISFPYSPRQLKKQNYNMIVQELFRHGYTEIYTKQIKDLVTGWIKKDGAIQQVTVNGKDNFKKGTNYTYDTEIVISYHTFK